MKKSVRAHTAEVIYALQNQQSNLDALLRKHSKSLSSNDKKFMQAICYGVCREWFHLDEIESNLLDKPLKARDQILSAIVRCGIYELGWMGSKEHGRLFQMISFGHPKAILALAYNCRDNIWMLDQLSE